MNAATIFPGAGDEPGKVHFTPRHILHAQAIHDIGISDIGPFHLLNMSLTYLAMFFFGHNIALFSAVSTNHHIRKSQKYSSSRFSPFTKYIFRQPIPENSLLYTTF